MSPKKMIILHCCLILALSLWGQTRNGSSPLLKQLSPAAAGFDADRLARIDAFIQGYINRDELNGAVVLVAKDGKIAYHKSFGYSDKEQKIPMGKDAIFRIASMTKPIISVAAMILYEEGKFLLDEALSKYIPEFSKPQVLDKYNAADTSYTTVPAKTGITIRQLLNHTSGIGYAQIGTAEMNAIYAKNNIAGGIGTPFYSLADNVKRQAGLPLFHQPGEKYQYGNNTDVLGYLIEVISGMPLNRFLQQRLFSPLGMKDTYFYLPAEKKGRLVKLYVQTDNGIRVQDSIITMLQVPMYRDFPLLNGTFFSGGAGLSSTTSDYAAFCQMLLNGGEYNGQRILSPATIRLMTSNQIGDKVMFDPGSPNRFGLGFGLYTEKSEAIYPVNAGSFDWAGMFSSHFWIDPKEKLFVIVMRNIWPSRNWDLGDRIKPLVYGAIEFPLP